MIARTMMKESFSRERRHFLAGMGVGALLGLGGGKIVDQITSLFGKEQSSYEVESTGIQTIFNEWDFAQQGPEAYVEFLQNRPASVTYGTSFSPEQWVWAGYDSSLQAEAVRKIRTTYGMREVRYGFRWYNVEKEPKTITLTDYEPSFKALLNQDSSVALNVGIKTFRYPEAHIPSFYRSLLPDDGKVAADGKLAQASISYLHRLFEHLHKTYSSAELKHITCINPENEAISPIAGNPGVVITPEYLQRICELIHEYFPSTPILLNTSGNNSSAFNNRYTLNEQLTFMKQCKDVPFKYGFDLYYNHPSAPEVTSLPIRYDFFAELVDNPKTAQTLPALVEELAKHAIPLEVTELQAEPWDSVITPGHSLSEFIYASKRSLDYLFTPSQSALLRVWGIEYMVGNQLSGKLDEGQQAILSLIQKVNSIS